MNIEKIGSWYLKNSKILMLIPLIFTFICFGLILIQYFQTGDYFHKDISLKGGISATVYTKQQVELEELQKQIPVDSTVRKIADFSTGEQLGIIVEASDITSDELKFILEKQLDLELTDENYSIEETGAKLGQSFYKELIMSLIFAFILMSIVVVITFRLFIPSIAVIQAVVTDIVITLAIINLLGVKISTAGIVAFLLIIGYSVDSDILLTTRLLKRKEGTIMERFFGAIKTGLTMTITTISAITAGYIFTSSPVFKEMFLILIIALFVDIFSTYLTNGGMLIWYCKKKNIR